MTEKSSPALRSLGRYASELLVIVLGITLSFLFDEWRQDREDRRAERQYLLALRNDLRIDSATLAYNLGAEEIFLRATERLAAVQRPEEILDSLHILIDAAVSYAAFNPATATYEELRQTGRTALLRDDTLRRGVLELHNVVYPGERELSTVDKAHVLTQIIPALSEFFPLTTDSLLMAPARHHVAQLASSRLRNQFITSAAFKRGVMLQHKFLKAVCSGLLARIEGLLGEAER